MYLMVCLLVVTSFISASESLSLINRKNRSLRSVKLTLSPDSVEPQGDHRLLAHKNRITRKNSIIFKNIISTDAALVITASKKMIEFFDSHLKPIAHVTHTNDTINKDVVLCPYNKTVLAVTDKQCRSIDIRTQQKADISLKHQMLKAAFVNQELCAAATVAGISLYDLRTKKEIECVNNNKCIVSAFDVLPDSLMVATGYTNGLVDLWDLRNPIKPIKQWGNTSSGPYRVFELTHTDQHIVWLDEEYRLHVATADHNIIECSFKIPYKNKQSNYHPCFSKINDNQVALGCKDRISIIDLASYQHQTLHLEGELPYTLYTLGTHDEFYTTTHINVLSSQDSSIQKWTLVTQDEFDCIKKKTSTLKKNN